MKERTTKMPRKTEVKTEVKKRGLRDRGGR